MYRLYVRDQYLNRVAEIDDYNSLEMIPRFNDVGPWILDIPTDSKAAKEIMKSKSGIIVTRNGETLLSGPVAARKRTFKSGEDKLTISGYDDNVWLNRIAYPEINGNFAASAYNIRSGAAETVMKHFVNVNAGPGALSERRKLSLEVDRGIGLNVTGKARFNNLIEFLQSIALSGGDLGFRVLQVNNTLEFQVYDPADKTKTAFFSPLLGNLLEFEHTYENPETNYVIVGGGGEGVDRIIRQRGDSTSIAEHGRYETFVDQRDTTDIAELEQSMTEELAGKADKASSSITPIDTEMLAFGRDYNLGDKVSVILTQPNEFVTLEEMHLFMSVDLGGVSMPPEMIEKVRKIQEKLQVIQDVVREVTIKITPEGKQISPVVGTPESTIDPIFGIFKRMSETEKRVSNLERR